MAVCDRPRSGRPPADIALEVPLNPLRFLEYCRGNRGQARPADDAKVEAVKTAMAKLQGQLDELMARSIRRVDGKPITAADLETLRGKEGSSNV